MTRQNNNRCHSGVSSLRRQPHPAVAQTGSEQKSVISPSALEKESVRHTVGSLTTEKKRRVGSGFTSVARGLCAFRGCHADRHHFLQFHSPADDRRGEKCQSWHRQHCDAPVKIESQCRENITGKFWCWGGGKFRGWVWILLTHFCQSSLHGFVV